MIAPAEAGMVQVLWDANRTRVALSGAINETTTPAIYEAARIVRALRLPLEIDARHVTVIDPSGFAGFTRLVLSNKDAVKLLYPSPAICFMLRVSGLDGHTVIINQDELVDDKHP